MNNDMRNEVFAGIAFGLFLFLTTVGVISMGYLISQVFA